MSGISIIRGGPDLPLALVEALEAERLVFFCGAGISLGTGLPDFKHLTLEAIGKFSGIENRCPVDPALRDAFCSQQYEKALDILEHEIAGNQLRAFVRERLTVSPESDEALGLHRAILDLSRREIALNGDERGYRLVTTNYDDRFELAGLDRRWIEAAPHLSRPRGDPERWAQVTFLHGRIEDGEGARDPHCRELVLTSADFGNAYLRDGFAARFVLELFREFTVLFIGYSINDPVMRYLVDIVATERRIEGKGQFHEAFAFASFKDGEREDVEARWRAKNVTPILYDDADNHKRLTDLVIEWARLHTSGARGRFRKFMEITRKPFTGTTDAGLLRTAAWALADEHGRTARLLTECSAAKPETEAHESSPSSEDADISWLGPLLEADVFDPRDHRYPRHTCKLTDIPWVAHCLCAWAMRHLESRHLVDWAVRNERLLLSVLREPFFEALIHRLSQKSERPSVADPYRTFWEALVEIAVNHSSTKEVRSLWRSTTAAPGPRERLMSLIRHSEIGIAWPSKPPGAHDDPSSEAHDLSDIARFNFPRIGRQTNPNHFRTLFAAPGNPQRARADLAPYLDDFTSFLLQICRLGRMTEAPFATGMSVIERPSITPDRSNNLEVADLSWLIEAMVLSFRCASSDEQDQVRGAVVRWRHLWRSEGFSLFGRLYLYAATMLPSQFRANQLIDDLLERPHALWGDEYRAEVLPVFRLRVAEASRERQQALVERLLEPPPADIFSNDDDLLDTRRGQCLAWLKLGGVVLDAEQNAIANGYLEMHPPSENLRVDEVFYVRFEEHVGPAGGLGSFNDRPIADILASLRLDHDSQGWPVSEWDRARRVCDWLRGEPNRTVEALAAFIVEPDLPARALDGVLWALASFEPGQFDAKSVVAAINLVVSHEFQAISPNATAVGDWLKNLASWPSDRVDEEPFFRLWDSTFDYAPEDEPPTDENADLDSAINAVGGKLADALCDRFWQTRPKVGQGLAEPFRSRLERLIAGDTLAALHARLVCMRQLSPLFAVDPDWTREHLLPRLSWQADFDAQAMWHWRAHLFYGTWSLDLSKEYQADFLEMLGAPMDRESDIFRAACKRFALLGAIRDLFSEQETRRAFRSIGPEGGAIVLDTLCSRMSESDEPAAMWRKSIRPWLDLWPADKRFVTEKTVQAAAELIIETDEAFPEALDWIEQRKLIEPLVQRYSIPSLLTENDQERERRRTLAARYPAQLCRFLAQILHGPPMVSPEREQLATLVQEIKASLAQKGLEAPSMIHLEDLL